METGRQKLGYFLERDQVLGVLLLLPIAFWVLAVFIYPLGYALWLSFKSQTLIGTEAPFVGFATYKRVLLNVEFWSSLGRSATWALSNAILQGLFALGTALLLNQAIKGVRVARIWIIVPWIIPTAVVAIIWRWLLNPSYGVLEHALRSIGLTLPAVLGLPKYAMLTSIIINCWRWFPFAVVILLARLQAAPKEQYEAAKVDGASSFECFRFVTIPFLQPVFLIVFLLGTLWSFNTFDMIWLLTEGGPGLATTTLPILIYKSAFKSFRMSEAAAMSVLMFICLSLFAIFYFKFLHKEEEI